MFAFIHSCLSAPANHDSRLIPYSRVCLDFQFIRLTPLWSRGSLCQKQPPRRNPTSAGWRAELASSVYANTCVSSLPSNWGEVANDLPCSSVQKINSDHTDTKETTFFFFLVTVLKFRYSRLGEFSGAGRRIIIRQPSCRKLQTFQGISATVI